MLVFKITYLHLSIYVMECNAINVVMQLTLYYNAVLDIHSFIHSLSSFFLITFYISSTFYTTFFFIQILQ